MDVSQMFSLGSIFCKIASNGDEEHHNRSESARVNFVDSTSRIEVIVLSDDDSGSEDDSEQDIFGRSRKENQHGYVIRSISKHFFFRFAHE